MSYNQTLLPALAQQLENFVLNSPQNIVPDLGMMRIYQPTFARRSQRQRCSLGNT